jgi:3-phenylpropionate/trans-cinnamate dioxygenase ferredoxin reductase component
MVYPESSVGARIFREELSSALNDYYRDRGVQVLAGASVTGIERQGGTVQVRLGDSQVIGLDAVVAGIGIEPNAELAAAGLPVANGIVVDAYGRPGREDMFAAGDVARFPAAALAAELRVEHEGHAKSHGRQVGANMAGAHERYDHLPFFCSDLFDVGYEAVCELYPRLNTLIDWSDPEGEGTITYLDREPRPRGLLLWNRVGHVDAARELIRAGEPVGQRVQVG